jgi:hypothetical protein
MVPSENLGGFIPMTWAIFRLEHNAAIMTLVQTGVPHATAILGGALLEETLTRTLSERLRNDTDALDKLTKPGGPMGFAAPKIDMLYMLGAIDRRAKNGMHGIAEIRNYFAHHIDMTFESKSKKMLDSLAKLKMHEGLTHFPHHLYKNRNGMKIDSVSNNRGKFILNLRLALIILMRDRVSHQLWSNAPLSERSLRKQMKGTSKT